jgi:hypothetical protein
MDNSATELFNGWSWCPLVGVLDKSVGKRVERGISEPSVDDVVQGLSGNVERCACADDLA